MSNINNQNSNFQSTLNFDLHSWQDNNPFKTNSYQENENLLGIVKKRFWMFTLFSVFLFILFVVLGYFISNRYNFFEDVSVNSNCPVFCGGCVNRCFTYQELGRKTCNQLIDEQCRQTIQVPSSSGGGQQTQTITCAGNGAFASGGISCCPGLIQCGNGRCGTSCVAQCTSAGVNPSANGGVPCCQGLVQSTAGVCSHPTNPTTVVNPTVTFVQVTVTYKNCYQCIKNETDGTDGNSFESKVVPKGDSCGPGWSDEPPKNCSSNNINSTCTYVEISTSCNCGGDPMKREVTYRTGPNGNICDRKCVSFANCVSSNNSTGMTSTSSSGGQASSVSSSGASSAGSCKSALQQCSIGPNGQSNCCSGLVCQNGLTGQLRCEQPQINPNSQCPGGRCGGAGGWLGFRCNQLTNGQCLENPATFNDYASAAAYAGACGQVDEVCVGGSRDRQLCGSFQIFSNCQGGGGPISTPTQAPPTPTSTPTPTNTPTSTPTSTPTQTVTCYRCTPATNDGNACESQVFNQSSCPIGWTDNSNCFAVEPGGVCPAQVTCYRCTPATNDGNACESQVFNQSTCPVGWTDNSNCFAVEPGGVCPAQVTCYRCTPATNDGNACESQVFNQSTCPVGWTDNSNCFAVEPGGVCPAQTNCYRCTPQTGDGNACELVVINGSTCPAGMSSSPTGCAAAVGGQCDPITPVTCYRCTDSLTDGNTCESFVASNVCPSGSSTDPNGCAAAVGGYCTQVLGCNSECGGNRYCTRGLGCINGRCRLPSNPSSETCQEYQDSRMMLICYRCTPRLDDGNTCESIQFLSENGLCPSGWSTESNCRITAGGMCPQNIPDTAIFDDERLNIITLGLIFTLGGLIAYRFKIGSRIVEKPLGILYTGIGNISESILPFEKKIEKRFRKNRTNQSY